MEDIKFKSSGQNPLTELSELRFEFNALEQDFDLTCLLRFGSMQYDHNGHEYEVGVSGAYLRLSLEGCETKLGSAYGESLLEPVVEENEAEARTSAGIEAGVGVNSDSGANAKASAIIETSETHNRRLSQRKILLPVTARPNNTWEIKPKAVTGQSENIIDGTAIGSERLCALRRRQGGNRMAIVGELQVSKKAIKVSAKGGNRLFRSMSEWTNKDAIVSQILKKAILREASTTMLGLANSTVVISRYDISEE